MRCGITTEYTYIDRDGNGHLPVMSLRIYGKEGDKINDGDKFVARVDCIKGHKKVRLLKINAS